MSLPQESNLNPIPLSLNSNDDFLIREILQTHDPDDSYELDESEELLNLVETTFCCSTKNAFDPRGVDLAASSEEPISCIIYKISNEIHYQCFEDEDLHSKTMVLLELLGHYRWDAKVVLALASFARIFALFRLILQLQSDNELAVSLALVKQLPRETAMLNPKFRALNLLACTMLKLSKILVSFEGVHLHHELVNDRAIATTKTSIYLATYWIFRSILVCYSQIADLRNLSLEQVFSDRTVVVAWGLHSLGKRLDSLCHDLGPCADNCHHQIETRLYDKLQRTLNEKQYDNQKALRSLFASHNESPFKHSSSRNKIGILEMKSKLVLLLISKPDLLPLDKTLILVQQITKIEENCVIIWIPIPHTTEWNFDDKRNFDFFSNHLPWFCIRKPWLLHSAVINYIRQEWNFREDPIMVVLDEEGLVANTDAMDMIWTWGSKAFPYSNSREKHLWEHATWTMDLLINGITSSLSERMKEGDNHLCVYGGDNIEWIKEFNKNIKKIKTKITGIHLEVVYVGCKNPGEKVKTIMNTIDQENLSTCLSYNNIHLFWIRLEAMKRSIAHHQSTSISGDEIIRRVTELLEINGDNGWAVIGGGSSTDVIKLDEEKVRECAGGMWLCSENVREMGLVGAIRDGFKASVGDGKFQHDEVVEVPYEDGLIEKTMTCGSCKHPMKKFVLYKCNE